MLRPRDHVGEAELADGQRVLLHEAAWASLASALSGGVLVIAFALTLGATPLQIGLLAAIPFLCQSAQLPGVALVERVRRRQLIGVVTVTAARTVILSLALLPLLAPADALVALIAAQVVIGLLASLGSCAINSWLHQLLPAHRLGAFFAKRLFWWNGLACAGTLAAGLAVERLPFATPTHGYALVFALAGLAGFVSSSYLARAPEPRMTDAGPPAPIATRLRAPFRDANFRSVLMFLASWHVASNLAAPFLAVYLMRQLGLDLATVTLLWVTSQLANTATLYLWGRLSDRLTNKAVLSAALPVYFACTLGLVFTDNGPGAAAQLAWLYGLHVLMGAASGGIGLATGNLGLKLAPQGQGTAYLAAIGLVASVAGGLAPLAAGALAQALSSSEVSMLLRWRLPGQSGEVAVFSFAHWEFLFALSAALGLYVMHRLSHIQEAGGDGHEITERRVVQQFALEALRSLSPLSSVGGLLGGLFAFERLNERRRLGRQRPGLGPGPPGGEPGPLANR